MNKYKNKITFVGDFKFHSQKEATRYVELKQLETRGDIKFLELQPRFVLQPEFEAKVYGTQKQKKIAKIEYVGDFCYVRKEDTNTLVVEDVKGYKKIPIYQLKKKLFLFKYPHILFIET